MARGNALSSVAVPAIGPTSRASRGGAGAYHAGSTNHCPSCGGASWHIGRHVAECAGCGLPLAIVAAAPLKVTT